MTIENLVEFVQLTYPNLSRALIIKMLDNALQELCAETGLFRSTATANIVANQTYYSLDDGSTFTDAVHSSSRPIDVLKVSVDGDQISRFSGDFEAEDADMA